MLTNSGLSMYAFSMQKFLPTLTPKIKRKYLDRMVSLKAQEYNLEEDMTRWISLHFKKNQLKMTAVFYLYLPVKIFCTRKLKKQPPERIVGINTRPSRPKNDIDLAQRIIELITGMKKIMPIKHNPRPCRMLKRWGFDFALPIGVKNKGLWITWVWWNIRFLDKAC